MSSDFGKRTTTTTEITRDAQATENHTVGGLLTAAEEVRKNAYKPYSDYSVGAALVMQNDDGDIEMFTGCNVEAVTYTQTTHAEQAALSNGIQNGYTEPLALALQTAGRDGAPPCGHCRQTLIEHGNMPIYARHVDDDGTETLIEYDLQGLLPYLFSVENIEDITEA